MTGQRINNELLATNLRINTTETSTKQGSIRQDTAKPHAAVVTGVAIVMTDFAPVVTDCATVVTDCATVLTDFPSVVPDFCNCND